MILAVIVTIAWVTLAVIASLVMGAGLTISERRDR